MTSLRKSLPIVVLIILIGCAGPRPPAPPPPPPQSQQSIVLPTAAPTQEQLPPTPTATTGVLNNPTQEPTATTEALAETETSIDDNSTTPDQANSVDLTRLPIGDNKVSTGPQRGFVWSCQTAFNGGGAFATGSWFNAATGAFDFTAKPIVDGAVAWPHEFTITLSRNVRVIASNDLPNHPTGVYPVSPSDDAYTYDRNPNSIAAQSLRFELPAVPTVAAQPSCIGGAVGIHLTGSMLYNAFDAGGRDAVAHELQDSCQGHPESQGNYHYHNLTSCLDDAGTGHSLLAGYAFDGFGIYGHRGENGQTLTNADLDECHGHTHTLEWDGQMVEMYHYHATWEFPYTVGCYRGASIVDLRALMGGQGGPPPGQSPQGQPSQGGDPGGPPDLATAAAQLGITEQQLREALGPPPPDFAAAAQKLGILEAELRQVLEATR
ncbi:MAG: YHYH protein [Chloroflexi bacterium]|nr:YHYH protein [Chloroflexota bacterium]